MTGKDDTPNPTIKEDTIEALSKKMKQVKASDTVPSSSKKEVIRSGRINDPPTFDGNPGQIAAFIIHVNLCIFSDVARFPDDLSKICFLCSFLKGYAFTWAMPYLESLGTDDMDACMFSFSAFTAEFRSSFGEVNEQLHTETKLLRLRQGRDSAAEYGAMFRRLSSSTGYNDAALMGMFREGLSEDLKDEIATRELPEDLPSYMTKVIELDNRIRDRQNRRRYPDTRSSHFFRPRYTLPLNQKRESDVQPMDLDSARVTRFAPLTAEEKDRRRRLGLCLYCGGEGHTAYYCVKKGKGPTQGL